MKMTLDQGILYLIPESANERSAIDLIAKRALLRHVDAWIESDALLVRVSATLSESQPAKDQVSTASGSPVRVKPRPRETALPRRRQVKAVGVSRR